MAYIYDLADVWASSGTTFTAIKMNVTDGGSTAGSLLMDLQVGGVSQFNVDKTGFVAATQTGGNGGGFLAGGSAITFARMYAGQYGVRLASNLPLSWSSGTNLNALDVNLFRDAANTLAQRNGVNAQAFNLYQSYTDASNYTRGRVAAASGIVTVAGESAGTGEANIDIALTPKGTGRVRYGTHAAIAAETVTGYIEIKDAGGTVRKIAVVS